MPPSVFESPSPWGLILCPTSEVVFQNCVTGRSRYAVFLWGFQGVDMSLEQPQPAPWPEDPRQSARLRSLSPGATDRYIPSAAGWNLPSPVLDSSPSPNPPRTANSPSPQTIPPTSPRPSSIPSLRNHEPKPYCQGQVKSLHWFLNTSSVDTRAVEAKRWRDKEPYPHGYDRVVTGQNR